MSNEKQQNRKLAHESGFEGAVAGEQRAAGGSGIEGEGSYSAARDYDRGLGEFVRSGRVEQAANQAEELLDRDPDGHARAERQAKARSAPDPESAAGAGISAVHVKHERHGWVVEPGTAEMPAPFFDRMDDALRRAQELAAEQHVPLFVHGPDGELIDRYEAP